MKNSVPSEAAATPAAVSRRSFLSRATAVGASAALGSGLLLSTSEQAEAQARGPGQDAAVLNFALNLEYLEAEFYSFATTGASITAAGVAVTGSGTPGGVIVKAGSTIVPFTTPEVSQFATELTVDERNHVVFERTALMNSGVTPVARPTIDLLNSFNALGALLGIGNFDPFANELNFLLATFLFEDVGVTAYKGGSRLIANKDILEAAAGILAVEAYHAGITRHFISQAGQTNASAITLSQGISDIRDSLDGADDRDQGVRAGGVPNLVPTDANSIAFSRTTRQVLNIVYGAVNASSGLFFPNGLNGSIR